MQPIPQLKSSLHDVQPVRPTEEFTIKLTPFDQREYRRLIEARGETIRRVVTKLKPALGLSNALDAGCGVGSFSQILSECGLNVCGFDARAENVEEAQRRFPGIPFELANVEDRGVLQLGRFDLVFCFGLLYHLENPLLATRNLRAITEKCLLLESMCVPEERPAFLLRDEPGQQDQSVAKVACYPSESSLVKMLYRSGFGNVYEVMDLPDHEDFRETPDRARKRTILLASSVPVEVGGFRLVLEPREVEDLWVKKPASKATFAQRVGRFLASPARRKYITLANRARRIFPKMPIPLQLPFGAWWLAENSALDHELLYGEFEKMETDFVNRLLRRDMTVVDVGAHHGLYTTGLQARGMGWSRRGHRTLSPGMRAAGKALAHQSLFRTWSWCRVQSEKILLRRISMWWMDFTTGATACGLPLWKHRRPPCASRYVVWTTFSRS
jgi:SAM-dependent methyltransferase